MKKPESSVSYFSLGLVLLGLVCLILIYPSIIQSFYKIPTAYNEGWNAAHAVTAMAGENIYSYPGQYLTNNYPPLYFYIIGGLGEVFGDVIFPARALSALSFFSVASLIFVITRSLTKQAKPALFSALLYIALMAAWYPIYIGINDPQLLANAFSCASLASIIILPTSKKTLFLAALLCLISGLIKHNLVNIPFAISLFLFLKHRELFIYWVSICILLLGISLIVIYLSFGEHFFSGLFSDRIFSIYRMFYRSQIYLAGLAIPLAFYFGTLLTPPLNRFGLLLNTYFFSSLVTAVFFSGGAGVYYNIVFDVCIALAIISAVRIHQLSELVFAHSRKGDFFLSLASLSLVLSVLLVLPVRTAASLDLASRLEIKEKASLEDIAFLSERGAPAICESMSLCYWAGVPIEYDAFNIGQEMLINKALETEVLGKIKNRYYSVIQVQVVNDQLNVERFPPSFIKVLKEHYQVARTNRAIAFFVPANG